MLSRNRRHIRRRCATCCPLTGVISPPSGRFQPTGRMPRPPPDRSISRSGTTPEQLIYRNSRSARPWRALVQNQDSKRCDRYGVVVEAGQNRRYFVKLQSGRVLSRNRRHIRRRYGHAPPTGICSPTLPSAGRPPQHPPLLGQQRLRLPRRVQPLLLLRLRQRLQPLPPRDDRYPGVRDVLGGALSV